MSEMTTARDKSRATTDRTDLDERDVRALEQYLTVLDDYDRARGADGLFMVVSQSGEEYLVDHESRTCECPDFEYREPAGGCKHVRRCDFVTGERPVPTGVDDQLGIHVDATPRAVATDGGQTLAPEVAEQVTDDEIAAREARTDVDETDGRPDDCDCWDPDGDLPCWPCYRDGFETPNPDAVKDGEADD